MVFSKKSVETTLNFGATPEIFKKAQMLRRNMTEPEKLLWKKLKDNQLLGYKFRRQHPIDIFVVDFYCHKAKLVIEIDGKTHNNKDVQEYDTARTNTLNNYGLKVIRFKNDMILNNIEEVLNEIRTELAKINPSF